MLERSESLLKMTVGDPDHRKEANRARFQKAITCGLGLQIPPRLVSQVPLPNTKGRGGQEHARDHPSVESTKGVGNTGGQRAEGPYPLGDVDSTQIGCVICGGISEGQERHRNIRPVCQTEAAVLGATLLGPRILREHSGSG